jgi:hypothetical protein
VTAAVTAPPVLAVVLPPALTVLPTVVAAPDTAPLTVLPVLAAVLATPAAAVPAVLAALAAVPAVLAALPAVLLSGLAVLLAVLAEGAAAVVALGDGAALAALAALAAWRRGLSRPRVPAPRSSAYARHDAGMFVPMCSCRYACRSPSLARIASAETPLPDRPNTGATSAGALPSTSSCHSTARHRFGNREKALTTRRASARASASVAASPLTPEIKGGRTVAGFLIQVPDHRHPAPGGYPVVRQVAHGREQVRAERVIGSAARPDGGQHAGERLGHDVVGHVGRHHRQRQPARGGGVPDVQLPVGSADPGVVRRLPPS